MENIHAVHVNYRSNQFREWSADQTAPGKFILSLPSISTLVLLKSQSSFSAVTPFRLIFIPHARVHLSYASIFVSHHRGSISGQPSVLRWWSNSAEEHGAQEPRQVCASSLPFRSRFFFIFLTAGCRLHILFITCLDRLLAINSLDQIEKNTLFIFRLEVWMKSNVAQKDETFRKVWTSY